MTVICQLHNVADTNYINLILKLLLKIQIVIHNIPFYNKRLTIKVLKPLKFKAQLCIKHPAQTVNKAQDNNNTQNSQNSKPDKITIIFHSE